MIFVITRSDREPAADAAARFAAAWSRGDDAGRRARRTARVGAARRSRPPRRGLDGATVRRGRLGDPGRRPRDRDPQRALGDPARRPLELPDADRRAAPRRRVGGGWSPRALHPALTPATRLGTVRDAPARGRIEARDGQAIVTQRVLHVAVETDRVRDAEDRPRDRRAGRRRRGPLARAIEERAAGRFVPVITLRQADYEGWHSRGPGRLDRAGRAPLAPTKDFARALLGAVGPRPPSSSSSPTAASAPATRSASRGLQARYDERLAGTPTPRVVIRDREDGVVERTLLRAARPAAPGAAHHARPRRTARRRARARRPRRQGRAGRPAAVDRRRPGRRQPARDSTSTAR